MGGEHDTGVASRRHWISLDLRSLYIVLQIRQNRVNTNSHSRILSRPNRDAIALLGA